MGTALLSATQGLAARNPCPTSPCAHPEAVKPRPEKPEAVFHARPWLPWRESRRSRAPGCPRGAAPNTPRQRRQQRGRKNSEDEKTERPS